MLVPENHTRNQFYLQNVATLAKILRHAGMHVRIGSLLPEITAADRDRRFPTARSSRSSRSSAKATASSSAISIRAWCCSTTICRRAFPAILRGVEQAVLPPLHAGWAVRRKSNHFEAYREVAEEFAALIGIDPWLVNPYFEQCGRIDFHERKGEECLEGYVAEILDDVRAKYREYKIDAGAFRHRQGRRRAPTAWAS